MIFKKAEQGSSDQATNQGERRPALIATRSLASLLFKDSVASMGTRKKKSGGPIWHAKLASTEEQSVEVEHTPRETEI